MPPAMAQDGMAAERLFDQRSRIARTGLATTLATGPSVAGAVSEQQVKMRPSR